jgi:hypothetical protein
VTFGDHDVQAVHHTRASHSNEKGGLPLIALLDVEIYLDNLDRVSVIEGDSRNARELRACDI